LMYDIFFSDFATKQLKKLEQETQRRITAVLERIRVRPEDYAKKLVASPYFRIRVGDYRVIIDILHEKLIILAIELGHRKNIYKQ
jgi:mRNA interferase RelE/StbE